MDRTPLSPDLVAALERLKLGRIADTLPGLASAEAFQGRAHTWAVCDNDGCVLRFVANICGA